MPRVSSNGILIFDDATERLMMAVLWQAVLDARRRGKPIEVRRSEWPTVKASAHEFITDYLPEAYRYIST